MVVPADSPYRTVDDLVTAWEGVQGGARIKGPLPPPLTAPYTGVAMRGLDDRG